MNTTIICKDLKFDSMSNFSISDIVICEDGKLQFNFDRATVSINRDFIKINYLDKEINIGLKEDIPHSLEYRVGSIFIKFYNNILEVIDINTK